MGFGFREGADTVVFHDFLIWLTACLNQDMGGLGIDFN